MPLAPLPHGGREHRLSWTVRYSRRYSCVLGQARLRTAQNCDPRMLEPVTAGLANRQRRSGALSRDVGFGCVECGCKRLRRARTSIGCVEAGRRPGALGRHVDRGAPGRDVDRLRLAETSVWRRRVGCRFGGMSIGGAEPGGRSAASGRDVGMAPSGGWSIGMRRVDVSIGRIALG